MDWGIVAMIQKLVNVMKRNLIFLIGVFVFFVIYNYYIKVSSANIVFMDQLRILQIIDKYFQGILTFQDVWGSYLEHRTPFYHLLVIFNAVYFKYNTIFEAHFGSILILFTVLLLYKSYTFSMGRLNKFNDSSENNKQIIFVSFILVLFSLIQWELITFSLGFYIFLKTVIFVMTFLLLEKMVYIENISPSRLILLGFLTLSGILLFGAGYSPAFFCSVVIVYSMLSLSSYRSTHVFRILTIFVPISILSYIIYMWGLQGEASLKSKILYVMLHPVEAFKYISLAASASVVGVEITQHYLTNSIMSVAGTLLLILYIYVIYMYFKCRVFEIAIMPIFLIFYSLITFGLILVARLEGGITYGMSSRYTTETILGLIGIIWILYVVSNLIPKPVNKIIFLITVFTIVAGHLSSYIVEWKKAPYRKESFNTMRQLAINYNDLKKEDYAIFQSPEDVTYKGLQILDKYKLNVFHDFNIGGTLETGILKSGWYNKEGNYRWIDQEAEGIFKSGDTGELIIEGSVPETLESVDLNIKVDNQNYILHSQSGLFHFESKVEKNKVVKVRINSSKSFIPSKMGLNNDVRNLSIMITNLIIN